MKTWSLWAFLFFFLAGCTSPNDLKSQQDQMRYGAEESGAFAKSPQEALSRTLPLALSHRVNASSTLKFRIEAQDPLLLLDAATKSFSRYRVIRLSIPQGIREQRIEIQSLQASLGAQRAFYLLPQLVAFDSKFKELPTELSLRKREIHMIRAPRLISQWRIRGISSDEREIYLLVLADNRAGDRPIGLFEKQSSVLTPRGTFEPVSTEITWYSWPEGELFLKALL